MLPTHACCSTWRPCSSPLTACRSTCRRCSRVSIDSSARWPKVPSRHRARPRRRPHPSTRRPVGPRSAAALGGDESAVAPPTVAAPPLRSPTPAPSRAPTTPTARRRSCAADGVRSERRSPTTTGRTRSARRCAACARAIYAPTEFVQRAPTRRSPWRRRSAVHRSKCEEHRAAVEAASAEFAGGPVTWNWSTATAAMGSRRSASDQRSEHRRRRSPQPAPTVEPTVATAPSRRGDGAAHAPGEARGRAGARSPSCADLPDDHEVDLDDLIDAPPESVKTPIERLAEAFPGSELVDEAG